MSVPLTTWGSVALTIVAAATAWLTSRSEARRRAAGWLINACAVGPGTVAYNLATWQVGFIASGLWFTGVSISGFLAARSGDETHLASHREGKG